ncbi:MAG: tetratricopeptide repeat protein [Deltaproteobacteria bacterium]|nr:tetratricopeptide repeat protein [Deltaproteobacteria bacterium]
MIAAGQSTANDGTALPELGDVEQVAAALQDDASTAEWATDTLLQLSAREPHPRLRAAILQAAAGLAARADASRATGLYRESFRLFPTVEVGQALARLTADDPAFQRLFRYGHIVDAVAALAAEGPTAAEALLDAARGHIVQGHGRAALVCLDRLTAARPDHAEAAELRQTAEAQVEARQEALTAQRLALAECEEAERANSLLAYAELLLAGDEPLDDAAAVLADAVDSGADLAAAAPLWVEVARALGDQVELTRALACSLAAGDALPTRLQHADELVNIPGIDRTAPAAARVALEVLHEAVPDDQTVAARLEGAKRLAGEDPGGQLEAMRLQAVRDRDRQGEAVACLGLASLAAAADDWGNAERHYRRVRTLTPQDGEALDFFERYYRQTGDHKRLLVALSQRLGATEGRETVRIALEMAQLCEGPLESPDRAVEAYQRVLTVQPDHGGALTALRTLHEAQGRWHAVRDTLERTARAQLAKAALDPRTKSAAIATLEQLVALCTDDARCKDDGATAQFARQILDLDPDHAAALSIVDGHLQESGRFSELVALLKRAAGQGGSAKAAILLRMGNVLADDLGQPAAAIDAWRSALDAQPSLVEAQLRLRRAARATGDSGAVLASLLDEIGSVVGGAAIDLGTPVPTVLGALTRAVDTAAQLPAGDAAGPTPALSSASPPQANLATQLHEAAVLAETRSDGKRLAGRLYALILSDAPESDVAVDGVVRCWSTADDGAQLQAVLQRLADRETGAARKARLLTLLADTQLNVGMDMAAALATAQQARQLAPDDPRTREIHVEAAIGVGDLDALRVACGDDREGLGLFAERALDIATQTEGVRRFAWWRAAATVLHDELGETERAALALSDAVAACLSAVAEPASASTQELLGPAERGQLCDQLRKYAHEAGLRGAERLALEAWLEVAEGAESQAARLALVDLMVASGELSDADAMARSLAEEAVAERDAAMLVQALDRQIGLVQDPEVADPSLGWESIADVLALATGDGDLLATARQALLDRCVRACSELAQGETLWPTVARIAVCGLACCGPADGATRRQLLEWQETACVEAGQWQGAVAAAQALAEASLADGDASPASAAWVRAAEWALDRLGDAAAAESLYRKAVAATADDTAAWAGLVATLRAGGDATALALVLDEVLTLQATGRESRARYALERAELSSALDEADLLAAVWPVVTSLAEVDGLTEAEEALVSIAAGQLDVPEFGSRIAERLQPVFERHGRTEEALRCRELIALHAPRRSDARISGLVAVADAVADGSPRQAFDALFHAVADAPERTDLFDRLDALAGRIGAQDRLQRLLRGMAGLDASGVFVAVPDAARPAVLAKLAQLAEARGDHAQVVEACATWRALQPSDAAPWALAERAHAAVGDWQQAEDAAAALTTLGTDAERAAAWLRRIERASAADARAAWQLAQSAAVALPAEVALRQRQLALARVLGDDQALAEALAGAIDGSPIAVADLGAARRELAETLSRCGANRALDAAGRWLAILDDDPADDEAIAACFALLPALGDADSALARELLERLEPIADARGESDRVDQLLGALVDLATDDAARIVLLERQAQVRETALGDALAALDCLSRASGLGGDLGPRLAAMSPVAAGALAAGLSSVAVAAAFESAASSRSLPADRLALRRAGLRALGDGAMLDAVRSLLEGVLRDDPADADAMGQLDHLAAQSGDVKARLALLTLRIARAAGPSEASAIWLERAQLAADADSTTEARESFAQAVALGDTDTRVAANAGLADLCESGGDLLSAAAAVLALVADHPDRDDRVGLRLRAAGLAQAGDDPAMARSILADGLAEFAGSAALFNAMDAVLSEIGDDEALALHLHAAWTGIEGLGDDERHALAGRWIGLVQLLHGPGEALAQAAAELTGLGLADVAVQDAIEALTGVDGEPWASWQQQAWLLAADRAERSGDPERELAARLQLGSAGLDRAARVEGRRRSACLLGQLGETGAALAKWYELLDLGVQEGSGWTDADVEAIVELADRCDQAREAGEYLQLAAAELANRDRKAAVLLRLADRAAAAGDREAQWALAQQVLADAPGHTAALAARGEALAGWADAPVEAHVAHARDVAATASPADRPAALLALAALLVSDTATADEGVRAALQVAEAHPDQADAAFAAVEAVVDVAPTAVQLARIAATRSVAAAAWLEARARQAGDWADLDGLLWARAEQSAAEGDVDGAVAALLELADMRTGERNDAPGAAQALDRARAIAPDNEAVLRLRLQLADDADDHGAVAELCAALAEVAEADEAPVLSFRAAQAWLAANALDRALAACDCSLAGDDTAVDVHLLRAELRDRQGQTSLAVGELDAAASRVRPASEAAAAELWLRAAELARKAELAEPWSKALVQAIAAGAAERALALAPVAELDGTWLKRAVADIAPALHAAQRPAQALELRRRLADTATGADRLAARRGLAQQSAADGDPVGALATLFDVAVDRELPQAELLDVLVEAHLVATQGQLVEDWIDRIAELVACGDVAEDQAASVVGYAAQAAGDAGLADRGADLWDALWDQRPDDADARDGTLALRRLANDPARLAAALEKALVFADAADKPTLRIELAALKLDGLGRPREALRLVQDVLAADAGHEEALALAERLADNPVLGDETLGLLDRHYRTAKNWPGLERVLKKRMDRAKTAAARAEIAQMLAQLQSEQLSHSDDALRSLWAAMQADPRLTTLEAIEKIARPQEHDDMLAKVYAQVLTTPLRPDDRAQVLARAAALDKRRGDLAAAERRLREALQASPNLGDAFDLLDALLDDQKRFSDLVALLLDRAAMVVEIDVQRALLGRAAELARAAQDQEAALDAYARLARLDPADAGSRLAQVEILREAGLGARLADALASLAEVTQDQRSRAELLCEAARLQHAGADSEERMAALYGRAFEACGACDEAFVWLERHLHGRPRQLVPILQARADALPKGPTRTLALRKLAHAHRDLDDAAGACAALETALADDAHNAAVLDELVKTSEALRNWSSWANAMELRLVHEKAREARVAHLAQLARVLLTELDDDARAKPVVAELQKLAPKDPATRQVLAMVKSHSGDPAEAAAGLEQVVRETDDPQALIAIHQQLADLYLGPLNNAGKGLRELQRLVSLDPRRWEFRRKLCDLYAQRQSHEALAESLKQWLAHLEDPDDKRTLQLARGLEIVGIMRELAAVLMTLGKPQEAAAHLRRAWELNGNDPDLNGSLAPLLELTGDVRLAGDLHDWLASHHASDKAKVALHLSRAALLHERQADLQGARDRFKKAMESAPGDDEATLGSARVCLALGEVDRAMRLFDLVARKSAQSVPADLRADAQVGMGRCRLMRNQRDQARACFEQALALVPGHKAAAEALAGL